MAKKMTEKADKIADKAKGIKENSPADKASDKKWIGAMNNGTGPKKGALHQELGVPASKKIPKAKIEAAAKKPGIEGKRAKLAETLEGLKKPTAKPVPKGKKAK